MLASLLADRSAHRPLRADTAGGGALCLRAGPGRGRRVLAALGMVVALGAGRGCAGHEAVGGPVEAGAGAGSATLGTGACPAEQPAPQPLPGVTAEHRQLDYWLKALGRVVDLDAVVLSTEEIATHNAALEAVPGRPVRGQVDLLAPENMAELRGELEERFAYLRERIASGEYRGEDAEPLPPDERGLVGPLASLPPLGPAELRVALELTPIRCAPFAHSLYKHGQRDRSFDRNNCSALRPQEPARVLGVWPGGMRLVRSATSIGFVAPTAPLSDPLVGESASRVLRGETIEVRGPVTLRGAAGARLEVADRVLLRLAQPEPLRAWFATKQGVVESDPLEPRSAVRTARPLTRRALLEQAWPYLDTPYGWGDQGGGRDCSRFLMDVFGAFGLRLPRHSGVQALAGSWSIELGPAGTDRERLGIIDEAARAGIVLLHFPGHIMLYLGRSAEGRPMAMHAFAEYLAPCQGAPASVDGGVAETLFRVDRVQVTDLELGRGTSRRSFLERVTHVVVLGPSPGPALAGIANERPAAPQSAKATCPDQSSVTMLVSPRRPSATEPLRVVAASATDLGPVRLTLVAPDGSRHEPALHGTGGPPYGLWSELPTPMVGSWEARLGEGDSLRGCERFEVRAAPVGRQAGAGPVWQARNRWSDGYENLYSVFVEQLFDYPPSDERTWPNLQALLGVREKNILFNHLGQGEDERLALEPDCADMPYFLRAYFAWKMRLPFGHRRCNRGKADAAPYCDREIEGNLVERSSRDDVEAFADFARRTVGDGVHSGNARTAPHDDRTDLYPVALRRDALRPGVLFADPYGHVLVVSGWLPQGVGEPGALIAAESQPDGTIGRRRFWRGSFLFTPETTTAGAGFKAFRPVRVRGESLRSLDNAALDGSFGPLAWSDEQYRGSADDFYDRMDALVSPRPLEPAAVLRSLVAALREAAERRVLSVDNGEQHLREHPGTIDMPEGHAIFETTGAWEDYATPSRDMRLLVAVDAVLGFPDRVTARPERFGAAPGPALDALVTELRGALERELGAQSFRYRRSDGVEQVVRLRDLVDRQAALAMAYNPNDCVEIRWGAPEGSAELASCRRRAPAEQRRRMASYRRWFDERKRPSRTK